MQQKYWNLLVQTRFKVEYVDVYAEKMYGYDKAINIICAIASSTAIAAWSTWTQLAYIWGLIIAVSQLASVIRDIFPFNNRIKVLRELSGKLKGTFCQMEFDWYKVSQGLLLDEEINELLFRYKKQIKDIEVRHLTEEFLPEKQNYKIIAEDKCKDYFTALY